MSVMFKVAWLLPSAPVPRFSELNVKSLRDPGYFEGRNLVYIERGGERGAASS